MKPISDDEFQFNDGQKLSVFRLMLGIGRDEKCKCGFATGEGADSDLGLGEYDYYHERPSFTKEHEIEIAEYAIAMWTELLAKLKAKP